MTVTRILPAALALALGFPSPMVLPAQAQPPSPESSTEPIRVFLDCHGPCDFDYVRQEITYVSWVRDRQDADVHVLLTTEGTGAGGQQYTLQFIGLRGMAGSDDRYIFSSRQSDTFDERRAMILQRLGLGLARYVARSPLAGNLQVSFRPSEDPQTGPGARLRDPWNLWVFTVGANLNLASETHSTDTRISGNLRARRVTDAWKLSLGLRGNRNHTRVDLDSGQVFRATVYDYTLSVLLARSLGGHWSLGLNGGGRRSSVNNYDLLVRLAPGIEYDLFPYSESSRRQFVFVYEVGLVHADYTEETIFSKLAETRPVQAATIALEAVQPWGSVEARVTGSTHLDQWSQNRLILEGGLFFRLLRGLDLNVNAHYSRIRDQLSLPKAGATDEEVLKNIKQLQTDYRLFLSVGLNYTFGSSFNNIVNPRFNSSVFDF